jgi:hypothetical protein
VAIVIHGVLLEMHKALQYDDIVLSKAAVQKCLVLKYRGKQPLPAEKTPTCLRFLTVKSASRYIAAVCRPRLLGTVRVLRERWSCVYA